MSFGNPEGRCNLGDNPGTQHLVQIKVQQAHCGQKISRKIRVGGVSVDLKAGL